jgi:hypothetical protein
VSANIAKAVSTPRANLVFEFMVVVSLFQLSLLRWICGCNLRDQHHPRKASEAQPFLQWKTETMPMLRLPPLRLLKQKARSFRIGPEDIIVS